MREQVTSAVLTTIRIREGSKVNPELVAMLVNDHLAAVMKQIDLQREDNKAQVSMLFADGIKVTAPLAEYTKIIDAYKKDKEHKTLDVQETLNKNDMAFGASASICGIGGGATYSTATEEQKKELRERFHRTMDQVERAIEGKIPGLVAMSAQQVQKLTVNRHDVKESELKTFTHGTKELRMTLSFQASATPEETAKLKLVLADHQKKVADAEWHLKKSQIALGRAKEGVADAQRELMTAEAAKLLREQEVLPAKHAREAADAAWNTFMSELEKAEAPAHATIKAFGNSGFHMPGVRSHLDQVRNQFQPRREVAHRELLQKREAEALANRQLTEAVANVTNLTTKLSPMPGKLSRTLRSPWRMRPRSLKNFAPRARNRREQSLRRGIRVSG